MRVTVIFDWDSCTLYVARDRRFCNARQELMGWR